MKNNDLFGATGKEMLITCALTEGVGCFRSFNARLVAVSHSGQSSAAKFSNGFEIRRIADRWYYWTSAERREIASMQCEERA